MAVSVLKVRIISCTGILPNTLAYTKDYLSASVFKPMVQSSACAICRLPNTDLTYNPNIKIDVFSGNNYFNGKATETNSVLNLPLTKTFGEEFAFNLGFTADLNQLQNRHHKVGHAEQFILRVTYRAV